MNLKYSYLCSARLVILNTKTSQNERKLKEKRRNNMAVFHHVFKTLCYRTNRKIVKSEQNTLF